MAGVCRPIGQLHEAQRRHDRFPVADAVRRGEESRVVGHRERRVDAVALGHVADARQDAPVGHRDAQDRGLSLRRPRQTGEQPDERRLARPVGSQQAIDAARREIEAHVVDGPHLAEDLHQAGGTDGRAGSPGRHHGT